MYKAVIPFFFNLYVLKCGASFKISKLGVNAGVNA